MPASPGLWAVEPGLVETDWSLWQVLDTVVFPPHLQHAALPKQRTDDLNAPAHHVELERAVLIGLGSRPSIPRED